MKHLKAQDHSTQIAELTYEDGLAFLSTLVNAYDGSPVMPEKKKRYRSALRSFSRFLAQHEVIEEDVFFRLNA